MTNDRQVARLAGHVLWLLGASIVLEIIAQALRSDLSPIRGSESALLVGRYGWLAITSLCMRGVLVLILLRAGSLAIAASYGSRTGSLLLGAVAISKFVIAFGSTNVIVHSGVSIASLFAAAIGEILVARKLLEVAWIPARLLLRVAQLTVVWSVVTVAGMHTGIAGVLERIETILLLGWIAMFAGVLWTTGNRQGRFHPASTRSRRRPA